jgi:hypothetical protein
VSQHPQTVAVDFDGVLHAYTKGWHDGSVYDTPMPGSVEALTDLTKRVAVFVHTTRDPMQAAAWLMRHYRPLIFVVERSRDDGGVVLVQFTRTDGQYVATAVGERDRPCEFWNDREHVLVTDRKLPAVAYVDDRAIRFTNWRQARVELDNALGVTTARHR